MLWLLFPQFKISIYCVPFIIHTYKKKKSNYCLVPDLWLWLNGLICFSVGLQWFVLDQSRPHHWVIMDNIFFICNCVISVTQPATSPSPYTAFPFNTCWALFQYKAAQSDNILPMTVSSLCWALVYIVSIKPYDVQESDGHKGPTF